MRNKNLRTHLVCTICSDLTLYEKNLSPFSVSWSRVFFNIIWSLGFNFFVFYKITLDITLMKKLFTRKKFSRLFWPYYLDLFKLKRYFFRCLLTKSSRFPINAMRIPIIFYWKIILIIVLFIKIFIRSQCLLGQTVCKVKISISSKCL